MKICRIIFSIVTIIISFSLKAQTYQLDKISPKATAIYDIAVEKLKDGDMTQAIILLNKALAKDSNYVDAILSLGGAFAEQKKYTESIKQYERARAKDTTYFYYFYLPYSMSLAGNGRFDDALIAVNKYLSMKTISDRSFRSGLYWKKAYEFALLYPTTHPEYNSYKFVPNNLGDSVNTLELEYYPSVTIDDSLLIFSRLGKGMREDFMQSTLTANGYTKAKPIEGQINEEPRKGGITISADGNWLIFAADYPGKGFGNYDLYICYLTADGWSEPENLGPNINTDFWESSPSISPDNRTLYFSSNRPGGKGGKDLYMSTRMSNGKWGPAVNMGDNVNSTGDELAPFIHSDNQTMYFNSDGLQGYGKEDIFITRKDENGLWKKAENLGYPINTIDNEGSLAISSDGVTAYYSSDRSDTRGGLDLYKFQLRSDLQPHKTLYVKGRVFDIKNGRGLPSAVQLISHSNHQPLMRLQTDETGSYFIPLPVGSDYTITVNRKGYVYNSQIIKLSNQKADSTYEKNIGLQPFEVNKHIVLNNIFFETNSYKLLPVSLIDLDILADILLENTTMKVEIGGHTDNVGKAEDNQKLSEKRAIAVVEYLFTKGVKATKLTGKGYGDTKPVAANDTEANRAKNRRTEFTILNL